MPRKSQFGFIWEEGQIFLGVNDKVVTSYTNKLMTISIIQNNDGTLEGFSYETPTESGEVDLTTNK